MLTSPLSGEEALTRAIHVLNSAMSKMIAEFCGKMKKSEKCI